MQDIKISNNIVCVHSSGPWNTMYGKAEKVKYVSKPYNHIYV